MESVTVCSLTRDSPDAQPPLLAMELARSAEAPHQGLRNMKSLVTDYFTIAPGTAP